MKNAYESFCNITFFIVLLRGWMFRSTNMEHRNKQHQHFKIKTIKISMTLDFTNCWLKTNQLASIKKLTPTITEIFKFKIRRSPKLINGIFILWRDLKIAKQLPIITTTELYCQPWSYFPCSQNMRLPPNNMKNVASVKEFNQN